MASLSQSSMSSSSSSSFDMENFLKTLTCPVETSLLTQAVSCVPCMHKINEAVANALYGTMSGNACSKAGQPCVTCKGVVTAYYVDHTIRDLAKRLLGDAKSKFAEELPTSPVILEAREEEHKEIAYPGKGAKLFHTVGDWSCYRPGGGSTLRHQMEFQSSVADSLIKKILLLGYADKTLCLYVKFQTTDTEALKQYLLSLDIPCLNLDLSLEGISIYNHTNIKKLFSVIAKHNEIPADYFAKLRAIIERGTTE